MSKKFKAFMFITVITLFMGSVNVSAGEGTHESSGSLLREHR